MRRTLVWILCLPLVAAGSLWAHELAYRIAGAGDGAGVHGYLDHAPLVLGILAAAGLVAAGGHVVAAAPRRPDPRVFALLPVVGFAVQEHAERWLADGSFPLAAALEPTFALGLLLQLPFALAALLLARLLLGAAEALAAALATGGAPRLAAPGPALVPVARVGNARVPALARGFSERGPPPLA